MKRIFLLNVIIFFMTTFLYSCTASNDVENFDEVLNDLSEQESEYLTEFEKEDMETLDALMGTWYNVEDVNITLELKDDGTYTKGKEYGDYEIDYVTASVKGYTVLKSIDMLSFDGVSYTYEIDETEFGYELDPTMGPEDSFLQDKDDAKNYSMIWQERNHPTEISMIGTWYPFGDEMNPNFELKIKDDYTYKITENKTVIERGTWSSYYDGPFLHIKANVTQTNKREGSYIDGHNITYIKDGWDGAYWGFFGDPSDDIDWDWRKQGVDY